MESRFLNIRGERSDRGIAMLEFLIALPFLVTLTFSIVDIGRLLNQYMHLTQAVYEGVRYASVAPGLSNGEILSGEGCGLTPETMSDGGGVSDSNVEVGHQSVHQRVSDMLALHEYALSADSLCIKTSRDSAEPVVAVTVLSKYDSVFPVFDNINIVVRAQGPFLF